MKKSLYLGYGCIFEDGEIKEIDDSEDIWMTWDEGWQWVMDSLRRIDEFERQKKWND